MRRRFNTSSGSGRKAYIVSSKGGRFRFQYNPTTVPYSRSANFQDISAPGMSYPLTQYTGGNVREFNVELFMYDKPYSGKIDRARKFLEKQLPPENNTKSFKKPPVFTFAYGYFVKKCVLKSMQVTDDWLDSHGRPIETHFSLTLRQVGK